MAWMRMMGAESVAYHRETVLERGDDHPGAALDYYASRGETPLGWGGAGAERLGLSGAVTEAQYDAVFGPGGPVDPTTGERLVRARRPGMELVVAAHKGVALLGIIGRAEDMHAILDAESDATLAFLDDWCRAAGGRRGRDQRRTPTDGLVWARTRHATSRAGDPEPHDHVLIANLVAMADDAGGWKALNTAGTRDLLHAATAVGRMASAAKAVELGYAIERDDGPSGKLGHWRIAGIPHAACDLFSKRSAEITAAMESKGYATYRARGVAARDTRRSKRHTAVDDLMPRWLGELETAGLSVEGIVAGIEHAGAERQRVPQRLTAPEVAELVSQMLGPDSVLAERKVFTRADVTVAVAPQLFGRDPAELTRTVDAVVASAEAIPLLGVAAARERAYAPACVLAREAAIAANVAGLAARTDAPAVAFPSVDRAIAEKERALGRALTLGQSDAAIAICTSGRAAEVVVGIAGSGKTTCLDVVRAAFESAGYRVLGTSTSGQAARTLGREAQMESRTMASLLWRLDHGRLRLDERTVVICDEVGMADDPSILRVLAAAEAAGAKVVLVGDHRQLGAVGPGGTLEALVARHPDALHTLDENVRQADPAERAALGELRAGDVDTAVAFYRDHDRIRTAATRDEVLEAMADAWAADVERGADTTMLAWRRANVAELNRLGRGRWQAMGRLSGPELAVGDRTYQAGDRIVTLAPGAGGELVTSERGTVEAVDVKAHTLTARMDDGRLQQFAPDDLAADRLAHGYAVTVHRSQGATFDTAHLLADGGGRELGYVGMSRARQSSLVHVVADDVDTAVEDLARDWSAERRQTWAIDSGTPATTPLAVEAELAAPAAMRTALRRARLLAERDAVAAAVPSDPGFELRRAEHQLRQAREDRFDLEHGRGRWAGTDAGQAARDLVEAQHKRRQATEFAAMPDMGWRMKRTWRAGAKAWAEREQVLQQRWDEIGGPVLAGVDADIAGIEQRVETLRGDDAHRHNWLAEHPEAGRRLDRIDRDLETLRTVERLDQHVARAMERGLDRGIEPPGRGIELGF